MKRLDDLYLPEINELADRIRKDPGNPSIDLWRHRLANLWNERRQALCKAHDRYENTFWRQLKLGRVLPDDFEFVRISMADILISGTGMGESTDIVAKGKTDDQRQNSHPTGLRFFD